LPNYLSAFDQQLCAPSLPGESLQAVGFMQIVMRPPFYQDADGYFALFKVPRSASSSLGRQFMIALPHTHAGHVLFLGNLLH